MTRHKFLTEVTTRSDQSKCSDLFDLKPNLSVFSKCTISSIAD